MGPFKVWKSIDLGRFGDAKTADRQLFQTGCRFKDTGARALLEHVTFRPIPYTVKVVDVTLEELGFTQNAEMPEIIERATKAGLELCPDELGPELGLRHEIFREDRKSYNAVFLAMKPIKPQGSAWWFIFVVRLDSYREKELWARPINTPFMPSDRFLFVQKSQD